MFWSKLWLSLVTLAAGLAVAVALLAPRPLGSSSSTRRARGWSARSTPRRCCSR